MKTTEERIEEIMNKFFLERQSVKQLNDVGEIEAQILRLQLENLVAQAQLEELQK